VGPDPGGRLGHEHTPRRWQHGTVAVWPGPQTDLVQGGLEAFCATPWRVGELASRVGVRLVADRLLPGVAPEAWSMPSQGLVHGAVQMTPHGEAVVMLANHPTTGGYPVIAVVDPGDLGGVAQRRNAERISFVPAAQRPDSARRPV
ncbi:MAG: hypothetical protein KDC23_14635, partial [Actinobacteria bacterium]|nr:hypothetical protein [Actinomycetota bacterium]